MQEFESIVTTGYWIAIATFVIILIARYIYFIKSKSYRICLKKEKLFFQIIRYATIVTLPFFIYAFIFYVFVLQKGSIFAPFGLKVALLVLLFLILVTELYYNYKIVDKKTNRLLNILFFIVLIVCTFFLINIYYKATAYPAIDKSVVVELPFKGKWIATGAGATGLTNHHDRIASQKYAVDISKIGDNDKLFVGEGIQKEESQTYGSKIFSPVYGKVVTVIDTLPDKPVRERAKLAGNHIIIQFQDTLFVTMAHLMPRSIPVEVGDYVEIGEEIGRIGLSGNTDFCHLHIHIQNGPIYDIETSKTYPIRFKHFKRRRFAFWNHITDGFLLSNDLIENF